MIQKLRVGIISSVHGIKGEVKLFPTTDEPNRFHQIKEVHLQSPTGKLRDGLLTKVHIENVKFFKNMVIVKFEEIHSPEEARKYLNIEAYIDRNDVTALKENQNYIADLIGLQVVTDEGIFLGKATDVFPTGANHVLEVEYNAEEGKNPKQLLIPYIKECILEVDLEKGQILVHLLDGLLEV